MRRAQDKADVLARHGPTESGQREEDVVRWYFTDRMGQKVPEDLGDDARSCGFADELALRSAIGREY